MKTTRLQKHALLIAVVVVALPAFALLSAGRSIGPAQVAYAASLPAAPVIYWSREAARAIVPPGPGGIFGPDNYGNKFPGEAAVYMGIVHAAIYDTALAFGGGYHPYAIGLTAPQGASPEAAIATATHNVLIGLQPELGLNPAQQAILDGHYADYMAAIPDGTAKSDGISVGAQVAAAVVALRTNDGRGSNPQIGQPPFVPPPPGPGVWDPGNAPAVGLRLPLIRPLALQSASQFRPDAPPALTSDEYTQDYEQVKALGSISSTVRTPDETTQALFWTDHDIRQWNDGLLTLAGAQGLDLVQTARMLAMAHVSGGDAMIACFDAKYHYWFWRPYQAIPQAGTDGNPATEPDATWRPLRPTPNFAEYPSAHACHSTAMVEALQAFFGTDNMTISLSSRVTQTTRTYNHLHDVLSDVNEARILVGFHFRNSTQVGSNLGRHVADYIVARLFQPLRHDQSVVAGMPRTGSGGSNAIGAYAVVLALALGVILILIGSLVWIRSRWAE
jgi:hypothetical protein